MHGQAMETLGCCLAVEAGAGSSKGTQQMAKETKGGWVVGREQQPVEALTPECG